MWVYILGELASILIAWLGMKTTVYKKGKRAAVIILSALPLILIAGFRYNVGVDYMGYYNTFYRIAHGGTSDFEPLYIFLNRVIARLGGDYPWLFTSCAVIFCLFVFLQVFDDSPYVPLSIFLLFGFRYYFAFLGLMRQLMADAILVYSIRYVERRDLKRFLLCVAIATGIHETSIAFLAIYWIARLKLQPNVIVAGLLLSTTVFRTPIKIALEWVMRLMDYGNYIDSVYDKGEVGLFLTILVQVAVLVLAFLYYEDTPKYRAYFNLQVLAVWATAMNGTIALVERLRFMFGLPVIILLPLAVKNIRDRRTRVFVTLGLIVCFSWYVSHVFISNIYYVLPYRTYWMR